MVFKRLSGFFLLLFTMASVYSLQAQDPTSIKTCLNKGTYSVATIIDTLENIKGLNITYNKNNLQLNKEIEIIADKPTANEILNALTTKLHIDWQFDGKYIVLFKKKNLKYFITGSAIDSVDNQFLPFTTIRIREMGRYLQGNPDGSFLFSLEQGNYNINFSFIGYETITKTINLSNDTVIKIFMKQSINSIEQIKVTKQRNLWGKLGKGHNIGMLNSKKIEHLKINNAADILQATVPGVWATKTSGAPGDHAAIKIRGISTIFGCNDPLYIIDGVAVPIVNLRSLDIADLNIHDIDNITILKDAASQALYGFQGTNGVVVIDTKRNQKNHFSFTINTGIQELPKKYDLMGTKDFLSAIDSSLKNKISNIRYFYPAYSDTLKSTDWQNEIFKKGIVKETQLSYSGNIGKTRIYVSGNYLQHNGIVKKSSYNKYTVMTNIGRNFTKRLSAEISFRGCVQKNLNNIEIYKGNNSIIEGINKSPLFKSTNDTFYFDFINPIIQGLYARRQYFKYTVLHSRISPDSLFNKNTNKLTVYSTALNAGIKYNFLDMLNINASTSVSTRKNNYLSSVFAEGDYVIDKMNYSKSTENYLLYSQQVNLNFQKEINGHRIEITSGLRNYADNAIWNLDSTNNYSYTKNVFLKNSLVSNSDNGSVIRQITSITTHLDYNYYSKYFVSLIANYERLNVNTENEKYMLFPSIAISWDLARENLFKLNWLNEFSLFFNWGLAGNYPINTLSHNYYMEVKYPYGKTIQPGRVVTQFANTNLKPETVNEYNVGIRTNMLNNRVQTGIDYYYKSNENLIIFRNIPSYYGGGRTMDNLGKITNIGMEYNMDVKLFSGSLFSWTTSFSISKNKQKVISAGTSDKIFFYDQDVLMPEFEIRNNSTLGVIKGFKYLGEWTKKDQEAKLKDVIESNGSKYLKADTSSKKLNLKDMIDLGKPFPDYTWFWTNSFSIGNLSLDVVWYGVQGISKYNGTKASTFMAGTNRATLQFLQPGRKTLSDSTFYQSSYFVEDASFIKLKQVTFSWFCPRKTAKIADIRLSISLENFYTKTKYSGYDPEASIYTNNNFSDLAVDRGAYPVPKSVFVTIMFDF